MVITLLITTFLIAFIVASEVIVPRPLLENRIFC
jgi:hypothetical protein